MHSPFYAVYGGGGYYYNDFVMYDGGYMEMDMEAAPQHFRSETDSSVDNVEESASSKPKRSNFPETWLWANSVLPV